MVSDQQVRSLMMLLEKRGDVVGLAAAKRARMLWQPARRAVGEVTDLTAILKKNLLQFEKEEN
jgi:hypothetical protein